MDEESGLDYCCCEPNLFIAMQKMERMNMHHRAPENISDHVALGITLTLRFFADTFLQSDMVIVLSFLRQLQACPVWSLACGNIFEVLEA